MERVRPTGYSLEKAVAFRPGKQATEKKAAAGAPASRGTGQWRKRAARCSGGAIAAKKVTATVAILFVSGSDPVALGLVASLNHPGGNLTGVSTLGVELERKPLELLHRRCAKR